MPTLGTCFLVAACAAMCACQEASLPETPVRPSGPAPAPANLGPLEAELAACKTSAAAKGMELGRLEGELKVARADVTAARAQLAEAETKLASALVTPDAAWAALVDEASQMARGQLPPSLAAEGDPVQAWLGRAKAFRAKNPGHVQPSQLKEVLRGARGGVCTREVEVVLATLGRHDRAVYQTAAARLDAIATRYGRDRSNPGVKRALEVRKNLQSQLADWPVHVGSVKELMLRYGDIKGKRVRVAMALEPSTYYNCRFRRQTRWRSFKGRSGGYESVTVYCPRGAAFCERLFESLAAGGDTMEPTDVILRYPRSNRVCEEGQIELLEIPPAG